LNILFISRGYPTKKYPMNGIFEYDQAKALTNYGHNVIFGFVDLRSIRRTRKLGFENFEKDGILHYGINIPLGRFPRSILSFFGYYGLKLLYKKIKKECGNLDLMHAHFTESAYSAAKLKELNKLPLVVTEHSSKIMSDNSNENIYEMAEFAYKQANEIISVSPTFKEIIENKLNQKSIYIPNIVDTNIFKYNSKEMNQSEEFNFISVGNLIKHKRMHHTIKAFNKAFKNNTEVKLTIIGGGPEKKNIESLIKELNLEDRIKLTGRIERKEIAEYFKKSDAFVLASKGETFGVVFIEAMATGLPVIATRCGGPEHFIKKEQGLIIEKDNLDKLAEAMKNIYKNITSYDNEKISKMTVEQFSPESVAEQITEVYRNILN
jgi:glycosyltransferase involved in cell wall biosynthesis